MERLSAEDRIKYYDRCYKAADGLWFVKVEERLGFDTTLELDKEVWKIMPKIQARFIKSKLGYETGLNALRLCFSQKLEMDGFEFNIESKTKDSTDEVRFIISSCPWHDILMESGREHISDRIGSAICGTEYEVWASEFGRDIRFSFGKHRICRGSSCCILSFFSLKK